MHVRLSQRCFVFRTIRCIAERVCFISRRGDRSTGRVARSCVRKRGKHREFKLASTRIFNGVRQRVKLKNVPVFVEVFTLETSVSNVSKRGELVLKFQPSGISGIGLGGRLEFALINEHPYQEWIESD